jgi:nucleoside-diphosphate-sugar epimerase
VVYGERDRLFTPRLARVLRLPVHPILGGGRTPMPTVYAGNLAAAVRSALSADFQGGTRAFNVSGDHPAGQRALLGGLARHLGLPFRPVGAIGAWGSVSCRRERPGGCRRSRSLKGDGGFSQASGDFRSCLVAGSGDHATAGGLSLAFFDEFFNFREGKVLG